MEEYKIENKKLANDYLNRTFYQHFQHKKSEKILELFLHGNCSANCSYCYLKKHHHDLYPKEISNITIILTNLKKILNWYVNNKFCCDIHIFSANWINTPLEEPVFNLLYETFSNVDEQFRPKTIGIPDNMQFLKDNNALIRIEQTIERFKKIKISVNFSASVDGYFCDHERTENDIKFYEKLKYFLEKYNFYLHPMISSSNIKYQIQNYEWWEKYFPEDKIKLLMTLEVRDSSWTDENIQSLMYYCDFLIDKKYHYYKSKIDFLDYIFNLNRYENPPYNIIGLRPQNSIIGHGRVTCTNSNTALAIRVGDLTIAPCHRLFYPELIFGQFDSDEHTLLDFNPTNVAGLIGFKEIKKRCLPYCEKCVFEPICPGSCQGANYEEYGNPWVPIENVCKMYKAKYSFIIYKLNQMGLFDDECRTHLKSRLSPPEYQYLEILIQTVLSKIEGEIKLDS